MLMKKINFQRLVAVLVMAVVTAWGGAFYVSASPGALPDSGGSCRYEHCSKAVGVPDIVCSRLGEYGDRDAEQFVCKHFVQAYACKNADAVFENLNNRLGFLHERGLVGLCYKKNILDIEVRYGRRCTCNILYNHEYQAETRVLFPNRCDRKRGKSVWPLLLASHGGRASALAESRILSAGKEVRHV